MSAPSVYTCTTCDDRWGPVGVQPDNPDRPQRFVLCKACNAPSAITAPPGPLTVACRCGATDWATLSACPACGADAKWWPCV